MLPNSKPKLPSIDVRKILNKKLPNSTFPVILGIRGYYLNSMGKVGENDRGIYDDAIFLILNDRVLPFNANTDPAIYRKGIATLTPGIWTLIAGKHKWNAPDGYPALRQHSNVTVARDNQANQTGQFGINLHRGGTKTTSSEGCQTIPPTQWNEFINATYAAMGTNAQAVMNNPLGVPGKLIKYVLVTKAEAEQIIGRSF